jgi:acetylglutamate kinase
VRILVKLGGTLLDNADSRASIAKQISDSRSNNLEIVVVHGGGKQMTRYLAERGIESQFVNGLRVTTPEVVDALLKVFAGSVNHELVASLNCAGAAAVGLSGIDGFLAVAEPMDPALGAVGRVSESNPAVLEALTARNFIPVVACVAGDRNGNIYNVNADLMAVACAIAFRAEHLLFLTDVAGVLDAAKNLIPVLTPAGSEALIANGAATGGMQAKLNAACSALDGGVGEVTIALGSAENILSRVLGGESAGTRMVRKEAHAA